MLNFKNRLANHRILLFGAPFLLLSLLAITFKEDVSIVGQNKMKAVEASSNITQLEPINELIDFFVTVTDEYEFIIQHGGSLGTYTNTHDLNELAAHTLKTLNIDDPQENPPYNHMQTIIDDIDLEVSITGLAEQQQAWLTIKLRANQSVKADTITTLIHELEEKLAQLHIQPFWTYTLQGSLFSEMNPHTDVFDLLAQRWDAEQTGVYDDAGSTSISFEGSLFPTFQAAIHRHSETGQSRLTVGIPAISIEY